MKVGAGVRRKRGLEMTTDNFECHHCLDRAIIHYKIECCRKERKQYEITFCAKCGKVTNINEEKFGWLNLIPRIGRIKSFLALLILGGIAMYFIIRQDIIIGAGLSLALLFWNWNISNTPFSWVSDCKYRRWEVYEELRGK